MKKFSAVAFVLCMLLTCVAVGATDLAYSSPATPEAAIASAPILADGLPGTVLDTVGTGIALCPRPDVYCLDVWDPVTCDNGVTYSNSCYAYRACATGCTSGGATS